MKAENHRSQPRLVVMLNQDSSTMIGRSSGMVHMVTPTNDEYEQGSKELPEEDPMPDESYIPAGT
jgi:hypothetical protein